VLAGVDEHLLIGFTQPGRDGRRLDELRAVADYRQDLQDPSSDWIAALTLAAVRSVTGPDCAKVR
jgi:hypothetical protein